jgi:adenosylcobinamide-GDP ribazoletransferase
VALVTVWKIATGALHLDGLADSLDGLAGGSAEERLAIMRDGRIGALGAAGLILVLLAAAAALAELEHALRGRALLLAPVIGRLTPVALGPWFAPSSPGLGLGGAFLLALPKAAGPVNLLGALGLAVWLFGAWGAALVAGPLLAMALWTRFVAARLGGLTGDVLGSTVELAELAVLVMAVALAAGPRA